MNNIKRQLKVVSALVSTSDYLQSNQPGQGGELESVVLDLIQSWGVSYDDAIEVLSDIYSGVSFDEIILNIEEGY